MFNWLFGGDKKEVEKVREETKQGFNKVKEDVENISKWVKHLNDQDSKQDFKIDDVNSRLSSIENEIEGLKNTLSLMDVGVFKHVFKTSKHMLPKQTDDEDVQSAVQMAVQTGENISLSNFSIMERALIYVLLNTDMKLSYEDLAAMLGKNRATIRGQINGIKQKSEIVQEIIEKNGKKRVYIPEEIREKLLKNVKVRVGGAEKASKKTKKGEEE